MNRDEMQALGCVIEYYSLNDGRCHQKGGEPPDYIAESLFTLDRYRRARVLRMDDEAEARAANRADTATEEVASRPNGEPTRPACARPLRLCVARQRRPGRPDRPLQRQGPGARHRCASPARTSRRRLNFL